jgi:hypothetical protein
MENDTQFVVNADTNALVTTGYTTYGNLPSGAKAKGIWVDLYERVALEAGFTIQWHAVSEGSLKMHSSMYTACVQDVADGLLGAFCHRAGPRTTPSAR